MAQAACQDETNSTPRDRVRQLILKDLGARRCAGWCKVSELAVYKWLERGTDEAPIPARHALAIVAGARADGLDAPLEVLWPAMAEGAP